MTRSSRFASGPARIATAYLVLSVAWIVASDWILGVGVQNARQITLLQTVKGFAFVTASGGIIYGLVRREQRKLEVANDELERAVDHARVLHRVLRHNLRNSCDVIRNNVGLLRSERCDAEDCLSRIARQSAELTTIARKSQHIRDVVFDEELVPVDQDLTRVVEDVVAEIRTTYPEAGVDIDCPDVQPVLAHPRLNVAVRELLTNAVTHDETDHPQVSVGVTRTGDRAVLSIVDDGPGLPDVERVVLDGAEEGTLTHSTGIGLWLVRFVAVASGGQLSVETNDGTVVTLSLPAQKAAYSGLDRLPVGRVTSG